MAISKDTVKYVAHLARLELEPKELERLAVQLEDILTYIEKLNSADVSHIAPTSHILPLVNVFREDAIKPSLDVSAVTANAPQKQNNQFLVPKVIT